MINLKNIGIYFLALIIFMFCGCAGQSQLAARNIQFTNQQQDEVVKIMTFNIRTGDAWWLDIWNCWDNRKELVVDTIADNAADVIGLQEAVDYQLQEIQQALPQYSQYAVGRKNGKNKGETCAILYRSDRFEIVDKGTFWFSENPSVPGSKNWGNLFARICSWVRLVDKQTQNSFYVYNVHLDNWSQKSREKSVRLLDKMVSARQTQDPFIVVGDFNMELNNSAMEYLQDSANPRMVDAWQSVHLNDNITGTYHQFTGKIKCPKIDHIPIDDSLKVVEADIYRYATGGRYPSDHFPVIATINLQAEKSIAMGLSNQTSSLR